MVSLCRDDPVVCIDLVVIFVGEFLKDWTTLAMLALLLALLFKLKTDKRRALELAYAAQMEAYDDRRQLDPVGSTWVVKGDKWTEL